MLEEILLLSKQLIAIESTNDKPENLNKVLKHVKNQLPGFVVKEFVKDNVHSLLIQSNKSKLMSFKIILNAHLDVVPAKLDQFNPNENGRKLYGRGAYDMKAAAAVEILVFKELAQKLSFPIALQLVTDEEVGGFNGTKNQIEKGISGDFIIAGEPTNFGINNKAKGIIWLKLKTIGKTGHGAYIWQGKNAIWKMNQIMTTINKIFPEFKKEVWKSTINLAKIETANKTFNKIPDNCTIGLDIRYIPEDKNVVINKLKKIVGINATTEILLNEPSQFTNS